MRFYSQRASGLSIALALFAQTDVPAQTLESTDSVAASPASTARVETAPIDSSPPDRYLVSTVLDPARRVKLMAMNDGIVRALVVPLGGSVKDGQEIVQLDRAEAAAHLKIAQAEAREAEAKLKGAADEFSPVAQAQFDAAQARVELAQLAVDRCSLHAPFPGRVISYPISAGQYVSKGTVIAELADVSSLRMLVPVNRTAVKEGGTLDVLCEGKTLSGKIQAILPLPDSFSPLRELALPWAAAWVVVANDGKALEPGLRVQSPYLPYAPIAVVPTRAVTSGKNGGTSVLRIVRNERVLSLPVREIGSIAADRTQISGDFRQGDVAIIESSVTLADGAFLRFGGEGNAQAIAEASSAPPPVSTPGIAPIGAPDSAVPKATMPTTKRKPATRPATKPSAPRPGGVVPF